MAEVINIGETVEVDAPNYGGTWRGEVLGFVSGFVDTPTVRVRCITPPDDAMGPLALRAGVDSIVGASFLTRVGDPEGMRADGCDDVDVTGRVRPYHRHAVTGKAHAHPSGGLAHTHQDPAVAAAMSIAASAGGVDAETFDALVAENRNAPPDPVQVLSDALAITERSARKGLAALVAGPWHLVTGQRQTGTVMHLAGDGQTPGEQLLEIDQEWKP